MPAFGGKIPPQQIWQLAGYVRSMSGNLSRSASPGRSDEMQNSPPEQLMQKQPPVISSHAASEGALRDLRKELSPGPRVGRPAKPKTKARRGPARYRRDGYTIAYVDVIDRPRHAGKSNYGLWDRLWIGILDLAGVWWLIRRRKRVPQVSEV